MKLHATGKSPIIALLFAVSAGTSTLLNASLKDVEINSVTLSFADLNLASAEDQKSLYKRLRKAANEVCETRKARTTEQLRSSRQCFEVALAGAIADVGNPGLAALQKQ